MSAFTRQLREEYAQAITEYQSKLSAATNSEELDAAEQILNGAELIEKKYTKLESAEALEAKLAVARDAIAGEKKISVDQHMTERQQENDRLRRYLLGGFSALTPEEASEVMRRAPEYRAAGATTPGASGGYTIAPEYFREIQQALILQGGVRGVARVITTATGADMPVPNLDDTAQTAHIIAENTAVAAATDLPFGTTTLKAWKWTSDELAVSNELMNDSAFSLDQLISDAIVGRFTRGMNLKYTLGNSTTEPQGVVGASHLAQTGATGQTGSITYPDLVAVQHGLPFPYRGKATWMFSDATLRVLKTLVDTQSRPLWTPGFAGFSGTVPDTILGSPYVLNADMANMTASATSVLYGDFSSYMIRDVQGGLTIRRLVERRALEDQTSFVAFWRSDGRKVSASTSFTIVNYKNSAT